MGCHQSYSDFAQIPETIWLFLGEYPGKSARIGRLRSPDAQECSSRLLPKWIGLTGAISNESSNRYCRNPTWSGLVRLATGKRMIFWGMPMPWYFPSIGPNP